jgi:P4 family phage/plasmid primase-like protien
MTESLTSPSDAVRFLTTLFAPDDTVLFRPIETWTEDTKKCSKTLFKHTLHRVAQRSLMEATIEQLLNVSESERANVFFGVAPRFGGKAQFDLAWQIRTVRVIWTDIDKIDGDELGERLNQSQLPPPSITVASGNGFHLYWLLDQPYLIDDAGDPVPVEIEWVKKDGKPKPVKYITDSSGQRIDLTSRALLPKLSAKAIFFQDILKGLAAKLGGDHTHDLSRILRVPGTLNRKNQRHGEEPIACRLVELHSERRYSIAQFDHLAASSPDVEKRNAITGMPLPAKRNLSASKQDELAATVARARVAKPGDRSQADFAACCAAIRNGMPKDEFWPQVAELSKFKERGREYFDQTWDAAADEIRLELYEEIHGSLDEAETDADSGVVPKVTAQICEEEHFAQDVGMKLYRFEHGVYRPKAEEFVRRQVKRVLQDWGKASLWSPTLAEQVIEYIRVDSPVLWETPPSDVLNVRNGLLDIASRQLKPHQPTFLSPVQLPVKFDAAATCPNIEAFVSQVFPADAQDLAWEIPAFIMRPDDSIQKAILAIGGGGNGKSTYLAMVTAFVGKQNTSSLSLHKLESDRFAAARVLGKLANICADLPSEHLAGTSVFKAITGGDPITGEHKFKDSFDFKPFCRLVFSANSPPRSTDSSDGFFDRWVVIPFDRAFRGTGEEIPRAVLDARLSTSAELSGLLNKALDALDRMAKQRGFTQAESTRQAWNEFHSTTDPLAGWLDRATVELPDAYVVRKTLRIGFNDHLAQLGQSPMGDKAFGHAFQKLRPKVESRQKSVSGVMQWCYMGIGMSLREKTNSQDSQD